MSLENAASKPASAARSASTRTSRKPSTATCGLQSTCRRRRRAREVPALYYLAGLTCTEETFMIKAGALRLAAEYGLALVARIPVRAGSIFPEIPTPGISASVRASISTPRPRRGLPTITWAATSTMSCRRWSRRIRDQRRTARHLRPFDGRTWRVGHGATQPRTLALAVGVRADLQSGRGSLGQEGIRQLPRRRYGEVGSDGTHRC